MTYKDKNTNFISKRYIMYQKIKGPSHSKNQQQGPSGVKQTVIMIMKENFEW